MCDSGLSVRRPARSAVSSPKARATTPCITSCRIIAKIVGIAHTRISPIKSELPPNLVLRLRDPVAPRTRMILAMHLAQMRARHVRVDLRRRDIAVAEHFLHRAQVRAALQQMRREAMTQRMRADPREPRIARRPSLQRLEETLPSHRAPQPAHEQRRL